MLSLKTPLHQCPTAQPERMGEGVEVAFGTLSMQIYGTVAAIRDESRSVCCYCGGPHPEAAG